MTPLLFAVLLVGQPPAVEAPGSNKPITPIARPQRPQVFAKTITHIDRYMELAIKHLERTPAEDRFFTRFFLFNTAPDQYLRDFTTLWRLNYNTLNRASALAFFNEVNESDQRLFAFDLRNTRWTVEAFAAVVRRDLTLREPHADSTLAERLRQLIGVQQDEATLHIEAIAPGAWLMREVFEPGNRTTAMYDLLYSEERFGPTAFKLLKTGDLPPMPPTGVLTKKVKKTVEVPWKGGPYYDPKTGKLEPYRNPTTGKFENNWPPGSFSIRQEIEVDEVVGLTVEDPRLLFVGQQKVVPKLIKDFPEDLAQFQKLWGVTNALDFLKELKIVGTRGEIVGGSKNMLENGSIVSYNDRIIITLVLSGGMVYTRTLDFKKTSGRSNPSNNLRNVSIAEFEEDAGEHFITLPCGMQHGFLTGGAAQGRKRVEAGDAEIVHSSKDPSFGVVKTQFSCAVCHAPQFGFITPSNRKINDAVRRGISLLDKDPDRRTDLRSFFIGWEEDADFWRLPVKKAYRSLTTQFGQAGQGWTGQEVANQTLAFRDWYDRPVSLEQAAVELGVPKLVVLLACKLDGTQESQNLILDVPIPRAEWDDTLFKQLALTIAAARNAENPDPEFKKLAPELLRQTAEKAGKKP